MSWTAHVENSFEYAGPAFRVGQNRDGQFFEVVAFNSEGREPGVMTSTGPLLIGEEAISFLQSVMDAAYSYGLRPSAAQDERHMRSHLNDMRAIAFHTLKMDRDAP